MLLDELAHVETDHVRALRHGRDRDRTLRAFAPMTWHHPPPIHCEIPHTHHPAIFAS
jgi:hypothetical protein